MPRIILIRNRGHSPSNCSVRSTRYTVALTTTAAKPSPLEADVAKFADVASSATQQATRFNAYLRRLLTGVLQDGHGTLFAVVENVPVDLETPTLSGGVWLDPKLPLAELHSRAVETGSADALADLQGAEVLLAGMANSDGVVVFGTDGSVLAYRVFLKPDDAERSQIPEKGGGRRRAFELMKIRLQTVFKAVFFRSHDGETICERSNP